MKTVSPSEAMYWGFMACMSRDQKINECMKDKLRAALVKSFPMADRHADILIKQYDYYAFDIAWDLYKNGFIFSDLDELNLEDALNKNPKFRKAVDAILNFVKTADLNKLKLLE